MSTEQNKATARRWFFDIARAAEAYDCAFHLE